MNADRIALLKNELRDLDSAAHHLRFSIDRTQHLFPRQDWKPEELLQRYPTPPKES